MSTDFEKNYKDISGTELWKIFREKCSEEEFVVAVGKVCEFGIEKSETIMTFFPNFTLHDITHIKNVCNWMTALLGDRANELTAQDAAMLLMSACCHDIGMSVSAEQEAELKKNTGTEEWKKYFDSNLGDWEEFEENKIITDKMLRNYVRINHHERVKEQLFEAEWDRALDDNGLQKQEFISLCKSHGEELKKLEAVIDDDTATFDMRLCAVLLRLADIFDFDPTRAPASLFKHVGLDKPKDSEMEKSSKEYQKNSAGKIISNNGKYIYSAVLDDPQIKKEVEGYLDWVEKELKKSQAYIKKFNTAWNNLELPQTINRKITLSTCKSGDFHITMDQDRIIELLTGKNLYSDPCVFVRELLQNSIDAILWRGENDSSFNAKEHGKITITTWHDGNGQGWFKIEDNGTGMDENIIEKYFLKAGRSYYDSDDFRRDKKNSSKKSNYKPISRFGIGILSCFLSDSDNKLEVSTKRYTNGSKAIRLSVTGLNGLYKLATTEQDRSDWQKMPVQKEDEKEYFRTEPGTTICVGMNLFSLGNYRSIKEVVDKYVQFPDMKVEYHGFDGAETYPTKDELMKAITELKNEHGDTCPIVCKHPIPDEEFEKLKANYPEFEWESAPEIIFEYFPFDNYTSGDDMYGMSVGITLFSPYKNELVYNGFATYNLIYDAFFNDNESAVTIEFSVNRIHLPIETIDYLNDDSLHKQPFYINVSYETFYETLSESEKTLFEYIVNNNTVEGYGVTAYNGVFADEIHDGYNDSIKSLLLLKGKNAPEVNVARDSITKLPFETSAELSIMESRIGTISFLKYIPSDYQYKTEKELNELIKKYPEWESMIFINIKILRNNTTTYKLETIQKTKKLVNDGETVLISNSRSFYDNIVLTFLKNNFDLIFEGLLLKLKPKTSDYTDTSDFPVQMFFKFWDNSNLLGMISKYRINFYSPEHSFSQWLIQNREKLEKELPTVYRKILKIMIMSKEKTDIINSLNDILTQIKEYGNKDFEITYEFYLTEDDFAEYP